MAPRDPDRAQLDFPALLADIIRELRLTGQVGVLDFSDVVQPVYIVSSRAGALGLTVAAPVFTSASVLGDQRINPLANTVVLDTGPLPAGGYDIWGGLSFNASMSVAGHMAMQHRNAANTISLNFLLTLGLTTAVQSNSIIMPLIGYSIALNERIRVEVSNGNVTGTVNNVIGFQIRPTP